MCKFSIYFYDIVPMRNKMYIPLFYSYLNVQVESFKTEDFITAETLLKENWGIYVL